MGVRMCDYIKKMRMALQFNYGITTTINTYQYVNKETGKMNNTYVLKINGKTECKTNRQIILINALKDKLEEAENYGRIEKE